MFDFHFDENEVIFKPKMGLKIPVRYACGNNQRKELLQLQELIDRKEASIAVKLDMGA